MVETEAVLGEGGAVAAADAVADVAAGVAVGKAKLIPNFETRQAHALNRF